MTLLQTQRLTLCPCGPTDRDDFIALEQDPEVMRFLNGGQPVDPARVDPAATFLMPRGTEAHVWTARRTTSGAFVGWFCLWPDDDRVAELGYRLRQADWRQGFATEGAAALVNWGFGSGAYDKIFASTMAVNHGSRRVLEKIGMTHAHTIHGDWPDPIPGSEEGEVVYEVMRAGWKGAIEICVYFEPTQVRACLGGRERACRGDERPDIVPVARCQRRAPRPWRGWGRRGPSR